MRTYILFITLIALSILPACQKDSEKTPPEPYDYTGKMGGVRAWFGNRTEHTVYSGGIVIDTAWNYSNDTFALTIIDKSTIKIFDHNYAIAKNDSGLYRYEFGDPVSALSATGSGVFYYYLKDSIAYLSGEYAPNYYRRTTWHTN